MIRAFLFFSMALFVGANRAVAATPPQLQRESTIDSIIREHASQELRAAVLQCCEGRFAAAVPLIQEFADSGDTAARFVLARLHQFGNGVEPSLEAAADLFEANVNDEQQPHTPSMVALASLRQETSPGEALQLLKMAAAQDYWIAVIKLGHIYELGQLGVRPNPKLAKRNYERAAEAGQPLGDFHMALCYENGIGVSPDALQATRLFRKAGLAGVTAAQVTMARRYYEGQGLEFDKLAAAGWLMRAAQSGSTEAMVLLGQMYESGEALIPDANMAGQFYSSAAKRGDPSGRFHLAMLYLNGKGTSRDPVRAFVLLSQAQELPAAQEALTALEEQLTTEQLQLAKQKLTQQNSR